MVYVRWVLSTWCSIAKPVGQRPVPSPEIAGMSVPRQSMLLRGKVNSKLKASETATYLSLSGRADKADKNCCRGTITGALQRILAGLP